MERRGYIVLFGDLKGTKSSLKEGPESNGAAELEIRVEHLQAAFSRCFLRFSGRSRSLLGVMFSDSVIAQWDDCREGERFVLDFAADLWLSLNHELVRFRAFVDCGWGIQERDPLGEAVQQAGGRLIHVMPASTAMWSVAVAEETGFPEGVFVGVQIAAKFGSERFTDRVFDAKGFQYRELVIKRNDDGR